MTFAAATHLKFNEEKAYFIGLAIVELLSLKLLL